MSDIQSWTSAFALHEKITSESAKAIINSFLPSTGTTDVIVFNSITIGGTVASSSLRNNSSLLGLERESLYRTIHRFFLLENVTPACVACCVCVCVCVCVSVCACVFVCACVCVVQHLQGQECCSKKIRTHTHTYTTNKHTDNTSTYAHTHARASGVFHCGVKTSFIQRR